MKALNSRILLVITVSVMFTGGCARTENPETSTLPDDVAAAATPVSSSDNTPTPSSTPVPVPTPEPSPTLTPTATPAQEPTPSPTSVVSKPLIRTGTETECCGLFDWLSDSALMVFEQTEERVDGTWRVDVETGERAFISPGYGIPSESGLIAFSDGAVGDLEIRDRGGELVASVATEGAPGWPSPDGSRIAWFERLQVRTPSSSVNRLVRLHVADVNSGASRVLLDLQAFDLEWLPDNRHLLIAARDRDFESAGIWLVDTQSGAYEILLEELFIRAVRLSPDGKSVAFMRSFNPEPDQNGVCVMDIGSRETNRIFESGSYRWDTDSQHIWRLDMTPTGAGGDHLSRIDVVSGDVVERVELDGQVLNEEWSISLEGSYVAFWRHSDGLIVVQSLPGR
jgi:hypothetical protein